jgi:hypothetical protein
VTARAHRENALDSPVKLDAAGFEVNFETFLAGFPYYLYKANEAHRRSLFRAATLLAPKSGPFFGSVGDGRPDVQLKALNGPEFFIELKYYTFKGSLA